MTRRLTKTNTQTGRERHGTVVGSEYTDVQGHACVLVIWDDLVLRGTVEQRTETGLGFFKVVIADAA